jgi:hypothetical protein
MKLTFPMAPASPGDEEEDKVGDDRYQPKDARERDENLQPVKRDISTSSSKL